MSALLPTDPAERKKIPIGSGVFDYFPAALAEIAKVSQLGNEQHNPGQPLHWARGKSMDQFDTALRHAMERGTRDTDGARHLAKACWRFLAMLQLECEAEGAPLARGARLPEPDMADLDNRYKKVREQLHAAGLGPHPSLGEAALMFPDCFQVTPFKEPPYGKRMYYDTVTGQPSSMEIPMSEVIKPPESLCEHGTCQDPLVCYAKLSCQHPIKAGLTD